MFKYFGKVAITLFFVVIGLVTLAAASPWVSAWLHTQKENVDTAFRDNLTDEQIISLRREEIKSDLEKLQQRAFELERAKDKLIKQESALQSKQEALANAEVFLKRSLDWLDTHTAADILEVDGKKYGHADVVTDANMRARTCNDLRALIEPMKESVSLLRDSVNTMNETIRESDQRISTQIDKLDVQEAQLQNLRLLEETREYVASLGIGDTLLGGDRFAGEVQRRLEEANFAVQFAQRNSDKSKTTNQEKGGITYSEEVAEPLDAATAYRKQYLGAPTEGGQ